jgi:hypothetical protein
MVGGSERVWCFSVPVPVPVPVRLLVLRPAAGWAPNGSCLLIVFI